MSRNIAIIGTGNMGSGLAKSFAKAGLFVTIGSREIEKARALAAAVGNSNWWHPRILRCRNTN